MKILLLFIMLSTLSCSTTLTDPSDDTLTELTFLDITDKLLMLNDGSYVDLPYSKDGKNYWDTYGGRHTFVEDVSKTKKIYSLRNNTWYYGHEIKSGSLYVTDIPVTDINDIDWEDTTKIGSFVSDYSVPFLNSVKGKSLLGCENYFDPFSGRTYIGKGNVTDDKFNFKQALSKTEAVYENEKYSKFLGLSVVNGNLYATDGNATSIKTIDWDTSTNAGRLK